jgi:two-component system NtrC family sensor kinase
MQGFLTSMFGGRLRNVLMILFSMIAVITIGTGAAATSRTITDYLAQAADERVARDMDLAQAFYDIRMERIAHISRRLAISPTLREYLSAADQGDTQALGSIRAEVENEIAVPTIDGNRLILVLGRQGDILAGDLAATSGAVSAVTPGPSWGPLPIVGAALDSQRSIIATEVVPAEILATVGLDGQARVALVDTPKAAPEPYDPREGSAGLALLGVTSVQDASGEIVGAVVAMHLFNNDFTLVDRIKEVAGVDTATIFFGDLRVSTNVKDEAGNRAIGTRVSEEVGEQVLSEGREYPGRAYVVKEWFITRYVPLRDYQDRVVGSLYVGAREAAFQRLVHTLVARIVYIALGTVCLAALIALPISIAITRPIAELVEAHRRLAGGEMTVRVVPARGEGELTTLARSFNTMAETLQVTQEQLVQKEKLASVGQLAAGVAHEINNPLGTILLLADVLYKETPEGDQRREDLHMITEQARRCKGIVFDLLSFARQNRVLAQETDVNRLVASVVSEEKTKEKYQGIQIVQELAPCLPIIQADPDQLRQMLINLMDNAADAMAAHGGTLTLRSHSPDRHHVEIMVSDTGTGIPAEVMANLFTPFYTTKPPGKGTGLGLSIIYGIVKMHRGDIRVESKEGEGTTFSVVLPVKLPEPSPTDEQKVLA